MILVKPVEETVFRAWNRVGENDNILYGIKLQTRNQTVCQFCARSGNGIIRRGTNILTKNHIRFCKGCFDFYQFFHNSFHFSANMLITDISSSLPLYRVLPKGGQGHFFQNVHKLKSACRLVFLNQAF